MAARQAISRSSARVFATTLMPGAERETACADPAAFRRLAVLPVPALSHNARGQAAPGEHDRMRTAAVAIVAQTRREQSLSATISEPTIVARLAVLVAAGLKG